MTRIVLLLPLLCLAAGISRAHTVWIEPTPDENLVMRFAEPDGKLEKSPGHLDSLSAPIAVVVSNAEPVSVEAPKKSDHFLLNRASPAQVACVETCFTVRAGRLPHFYARWQPADAGASKPLLTLDLVPTGVAGEVRVYFRGKPLGNIKATLRTPDEKEQDLTADADGFLRVRSSQHGQHLLSIAHHREPLAGFFGGRPYEQTSHNAALTWRQP